MATKKKGKKSNTHKRRHHMGATKITAVLTKVAATAAGAVAGVYINNMIKTSFSSSASNSLPSWTGGAVLIAAGAILPRVVKAPIMSDVADGLTAAGAIFVLNETFLNLPGISGVGYMPHTMRSTPKLNAPTIGAPGFMDKTVSGTRDLAVIGALYDN